MCERCGNNPIRYTGKGLCTTCYTREWSHATGRRNPNFVQPKLPPKLCACGCGAQISRRATYTYEHYPRPDQRGRQHTEESRRKMSAAHQANPNRPWLGKTMPSDVKQRMSDAQKGRPKSAAHRAAIAAALRGADPAIALQCRLIRKWAVYRAWRKAVLERDRYTCQLCGQVGGKIEADHIQPVSVRPDLILSVANGRALCVTCHRATDSYGHKVKSLRGYQQRVVLQIPLEMLTP